MSESYREQRPLLGEEYSDEEPLGREYRRGVGFRGRARNKVKGAAAVIANWPDRWSSSVTLWWIIIGMVLLTVLVIYNVALTIALLPSHQNIVRVKDNAVSQKQTGIIKVPEVFMHVFIDVNEEIDANKYIPAIRRLTDNHTGFSYNLIFIVNDTLVENDPHSSDELNNKIVLDDIFNTKSFTYKHITKVHNINVMQISLTDYMGSSSIKKRWRLIQPDFIPFLVRAISIWDNSGIAFNPLIIKSDYPAFIQKLHSILETYGKPNEEMKIDTTMKPRLETNKKLNNIRDIIEALESDNELNDHAQENLTEAETNDIEMTLALGRKLLSIETKDSSEVSKSTPHYNQNNNEKIHQNGSRFRNKTFSDILPKLNMLPLFLDLILNKKYKTDNVKLDENKAPVLVRKRKSPLTVLSKTKALSKQTEKSDTLKPMIIATKVKGLNQDIKEIELEDSYFPATWDRYDKLTIDLKGNIIAAEVSCHAFIGTVFDNVFHKPEEENVTGFLIRELSLFCNGVLSRCKGIDVILL